MRVIPSCRRLLLMRILFCTLGYPPGPVGGAERQAQLQARELVRRGNDVTIVCPRSRRLPPSRDAGIEVRRLPRIDRRPFRTLSYLPALAVFLLRHLDEYDLVHVHLANLQADVVALAAAIRPRPMYVKVAAGGYRGEVCRMRRVAWLTRYSGLRRAQRVQAISDEILDDLRRIGVDPGQIVRIPNGLDQGRFHPVSRQAKRDIRVRLGLPVDQVIVLYSGRFAGYKGVPDLLEAWRACRPPRSRLVLLGEPALDDPIGELPMSEGVEVRPWTHEVADYLQAADVFILPSYVEGMSNALLEAMGCGLAVVATRVGAAPTMIEDGLSGLLVEPRAREQLVSAIQRLVSDPGERARLGAAAVATVAERYAIASVVDRIEATYREMLGAAG